MGYLFLAIAIAAGMVKGFCGKKTGNLTREVSDAVSVNIIRMVLCIIIGFALIVVQGNLPLMATDISALLITAMSGIATSIFVVTWLLSIRQCAYLMVEISMMLSVLVPIITSAVLFREKVELKDILGIALLVAAAAIMSSYNNTQKKKLTVKSVLVLVVCGLSYGLSDLAQKFFVKTAIHTPISIFNFYTYVFAALTLVPLLLAFSKGSVSVAKNNLFVVGKKAFGFIAVMSVCLFLNSYFKTTAAIYLDASQLYPLNQGLVIVLSAIMAAIFFKEKITARCLLGMVIAFAGLIFINVL